LEILGVFLEERRMRIAERIRGRNGSDKQCGHRNVMGGLIFKPQMTQMGADDEDETAVRGMKEKYPRNF